MTETGAVFLAVFLRWLFDAIVFFPLHFVSRFQGKNPSRAPLHFSLLNYDFCLQD